jgi:hypothetical protein
MKINDDAYGEHTKCLPITAKNSLFRGLFLKRDIRFAGAAGRDVFTMGLFDQYDLNHDSKYRLNV